MAPTLSTARLLSLLPLFLASASARPGRGRCRPSLSLTLSSVETSVSTLPASSDVISISTSTEVIPSSTSSVEVISTSTSSEEVIPTSTSSEQVIPTSTSSEEVIPSTSSEEVIPSSTSTEEFISSSTSSDVSSSTIPEPEPSTTSVEASTTTEAPISSETPSSSSIPSSTTPPTSTTPEAPPMTTITSCPPAPTLAGPAQCYSGALPAGCEKFSSMPANFNSRAMSSSLYMCRISLTAYGNLPNPTASACFPTTTAANPPNLAAATETLASVYSCLRTANVVCSYNADCQTKTYPVGEVPEPTPTPTPAIGVDLLYDGGFESGTYGNWSVPKSPNVPTELSTQNPHTGSWAYHVTYANINGGSIELSRVVLGIEPGRQYQMKAWISHTNPAGATTRFALQAYPGDFTTPSSEINLQSLPANTWALKVITFTPTTSWIQLRLSGGGTVAGVTGSPGGVDHIYFDDVTLIRLN